MNRYKPVFLVALCGALASCASSAGTESVAAADGLTCRKEASIGSKLGHTVCTTRAEREEAARITQEQRRTRSRTDVADGEITADP